jgi:hypothetical protein
LHVFNFSTYFWWNCKTQETGIKYPTIDLGSCSQFTPLVLGDCGVFVSTSENDSKVYMVDFGDPAGPRRAFSLSSRRLLSTSKHKT